MEKKTNKLIFFSFIINQNMLNLKTFEVQVCMEYYETALLVWKDSGIKMLEDGTVLLSYNFHLSRQHRISTSSGNMSKPLSRCPSLEIDQEDFAPRFSMINDWLLGPQLG